MSPIIHTARLTLRPFTQDDAPELHRITNQPHVLQWMPGRACGLEKTRELIDKYAVWHETAPVRPFVFALAMELEGILIGFVCINNIPVVDDDIEVAYYIDAAHQGHGYTSEAAKALSHWFLEAYHLPHLIAIVEPENRLSQRVVEKSGYERQGSRFIFLPSHGAEKEFFYYRLYSAPGDGHDAP